MVWSNKLCLLLLVIFLFNWSICAPVPNEVTDEEFMNYLARNGYTDKPLQKLTPKEKSKAIRGFKVAVGLEDTDEITTEAKNFIRKPRCGRKNNHKKDMMKKASSGYYGKWKKKHLTYKINNYPKNGLSRSTTIKEIERAFELWEEKIDLTFQLVNEGPVDIDITFGSEFGSDGEGDTLAYAYFPQKGDAYFDDENWTSNTTSGINLLAVAAHEFGHSLGLEHSNVTGALMYAYYAGYDPNLKLHRDDTSRIQHWYGPKKTRKKCPMEQMDNIIQTSSETIYVVKENRCWKVCMKKEKVMENYPKLVTEVWPYNFMIYQQFGGNPLWNSIRNNAIQDKIISFVLDGQVLVFKGMNSWMFNVPNEKNPKKMLFVDRSKTNVFGGIPVFIDAAYYDGKKYIYFFKNEHFYKFDKSKIGNSKYKATAQPISDWYGCKTLK